MIYAVSLYHQKRYMLFPWKKVWVGVSIEEERWILALPIQYRFPWTDNTFSDKANIESDSWAVDTIVDSINSEVTKQRAEWTIWGQVYPNGIWFFLKALLWNVESSWADWVYEHTFTLLESNTHPTLTVWINTPLWWTAYALANIESMDFTAEVWGKFTVSINLKAKKWEETTHSVSYLDENWFVANMLKVFIADTTNWLDNAENICLQSITISFKKEIKDIECLSSLDPIDYINASFSIEWSMEMMFENNTYKNYFLNWTPKALRILAEDTKHPYEWVDNYPTFMLDLAKVIITEWTPEFTVDDITKQSISFKWHYDLRSRKAVEIYLKNTQPSYWWESITPEPEWDATYTSQEIYNPEDGRYEYHVTKTVWSTTKTIKLYQNYSPSTEWLSWSIIRVKEEYGRETHEESISQVNPLTWNWLLNYQLNANDFWESNWNFLWSFDLNTEYVHYYIQKLDSYHYYLWWKYLNDENLLNIYPFTISQDNTLIKHGYEGDEIIAWWEDAVAMINYIHNHEDSIVDNDNFEAELRELNRYNYSMNMVWNEYHVQVNYSWIQNYYALREYEWAYYIIDQTHGSESEITQEVYDWIVTKFWEFRTENWYNEDATYISINNTQYNVIMWLLNYDAIIENVYEWTDEVL